MGAAQALPSKAGNAFGVMFSSKTSRSQEGAGQSVLQTSFPLAPQHSGPSQNPTQAALCKTKEPWSFPLKNFIFSGGEERAVCGWTAILAKHPPEIQHIGKH